MPAFNIALILLLEGFCSISIEVLAIRQLLPFVGNSVIITSLIIGVFLLFLSLGYWYGGRLSAHFLKTLQRNFFIAALLTGIGLSLFFMAHFFTVTFTTSHINIIVCVIFYLLVVVAPLIFLLGQTIPIASNLFNKEIPVAKISANSLFISTAGSFLGAVLTSLVLFNVLGVAYTVFINAMMLFFLSWLSTKNRSPLAIGIGLFFGYFIFTINVSIEKQNFVKTNSYANYQVQQTFDQIDFISNYSVASRLTNQHTAAPYIEKIENILFKTLKLRDKTILVIGAGGFTLSASGTYGNNITYLDIDPQIKTIAETFFLRKKINGHFISDDARAFLRKTKKGFDVIISDAYKSTNNIPTALLTKEYYQTIKTHLKPNGIAIFNIIANPFLNDHFSKMNDNTINSVFKSCTKAPLSFKSQLANILYLCKKSRLEAISTTFTDNLNQAALRQFEVMDKRVRSLNPI